MKTTYLTLTFVLTALITISAQDCISYVPSETGTQLEYTHFDKKDKITGNSILKVDRIVKNDSATLFYIKQIHTDHKGGNIVESELEFKCSKGIFYTDLTTYIDKETLKAYEDMKVSIKTRGTEFPLNVLAGERLNNALVQIEIETGSVPIVYTVDIKNRLVEDIDSLSTPAGRFPCIRISEDVISNFGFMKFEHHQISWYSENIGTLRSETYKNEKLISYSEITAINKE